MTRRQHVLAVVSDERTLGQAVERLLDDPQRLAHLLDPDLVAVVVVPLAPDGDLEVEVLVGAVWHRLAQVPRDACAAQQRPGHAEPQQLLPREHADVARAREPDLVLVEQRRVLLEPLRKDANELAALLVPARWDVL